MKKKIPGSRTYSKKKSNKSEWEEKLFLEIRAEKIVCPVREHKFHPARKWRFDFSWIDKQFAVEVQGGTFIPFSKHSYGKGYENDCEKYAEAMKLGWDVYCCTPNMITSGHAIDMIKFMLENKNEHIPETQSIDQDKRTS